MEQPTALPAADEAIVTIPWDQLHDSPLQYRKTYSQATIEEIAATIKDTGRIHQALVVRLRYPNPPFRDQYDPQDGYEIVFGHTRKRAGMLAGLAGGPCVVRAMSDAEVRAAQAAENIARADVHPIEEAEGFRTMIDEDGITADELATTLGKSRSYVYGRLKLLALCPEVRKAVLAGDVDTEVGLLIARVGSHKMQAKALGYIKGKYWDIEDGGKKSFRQIRELLNERFTLDLKTALFDTTDETLVPSAGHCGRCPKRSGNAPEFVDIAEGNKPGRFSRQNTGPDVCTDPDCFAEKKKAHLKRQADALTKAGKVVVQGAAARAAVGADGKVKGAYVPLKDVKDQLAKARLAAQRDSAIVPPPVVVIQNPRDGKTVEAVKVCDLVAAGVREKEAPKPARASGSSRDWEAERREREARAKQINEQRMAVFRAVHHAALAAERSADEHRILLDYLLDQNEYGDGGLLLVAKLWGYEEERQFINAVQSMPLAHQALVMVEIAMTLNLEDGGWGNEAEPEFLRAAAKLYGIDPDAPPPTPSTAAQAQEEAAGKAKGKGSKWVKVSKLADDPDFTGEDQTDDAGSAGGSTSTAEAPSKAARAPGGAAGASRKGGKPAKAAEQTDDAGSAGGSAGQVDAFAEAAS